MQSHLQKLQKVFSAKAEIQSHLNLEPRFLKSVSLADQKAETTPSPSKKLELGFLKSVSLADQKAETTPIQIGI